MAPWGTSCTSPRRCGFLAYLHFDQLVKRGYVPFKDDNCFTNEYLDTPVDWIPSILPSARLHDLPTFIRTTDADHTMLTINIKQCELDSPAADGILLNTFDTRGLGPRRYLGSPPQHLHHQLARPGSLPTVLRP